jgi:putative hydrolase of the HAD superfamily
VITTVTFDFWETLVRDSRDNLVAQRGQRVETLRAALARCGRPATTAAVEEAYDRSEALLVERFWSRHRDTSCREQVCLVLECAAPGITADMPEALLEESIDSYISPVLDWPPALQPGAGETVRELAARGIALGIVSNTGRTPGIVLRRLLERYDLLRYFAVISYSDELGVRKPDPEIFRVTLSRANARPVEAAHVGDNPVDDVAGARAVGIRAIHYASDGRPPAPHADLVVTHLGELLAHL